MSPSSSRLGMSPLYSRSPSASPSRSSSPTPSYDAASLSSAASSPISDPEDRCPTYSPVETFSDEEGADDTIGGTLQHEVPSSPPKKKSKVKSSSYVSMYQPMYVMPSNFKRSISSSSWQSGTKPNSITDNSHINIILQILSRLAQAEIPHEDLASLRTFQALINFLCNNKNASKRAGRILLRLSKNLYCLMPLVNQRTMSWLKPQIENRPTLKDSPCPECSDLLDLSRDLVQNFSLLAETGYAEGVMCHKLVKGIKSEKLSVSIGIPLLVRPRKLLVNMLINHEGLDVLLDIIEHLGSDDVGLYLDAIYSLSCLCAHIGVVAPNLKLSPTQASDKCLFEDQSWEPDLRIVVDDGQILDVKRSVLAEQSGVFEAMLSGNWSESSLSEVRIKCTGFQALQCLVHYLYGCQWCPTMKNAEPQVLLELTSLTDKYLLSGKIRYGILGSHVLL